MPYLEPYRRAELLSRAKDPCSAGDINFLISSLCDSYLREFGTNYSNINILIGVLECAKLELYRRIAAPYEDGKLEQNGDVYED